MSRPDYDKIERLERELGINQPEPQPLRPAFVVCLTKDCEGDTTEVRNWYGVVIRAYHHCRKPE
ncbi:MULTISPECIES: hypothetical protein [Streptomyces]|uniref:Uncharacterized protein n=2 Tax=Streptomyces rimosus subsp. rimosus TaxID=132474 RepID=L8EY62_STRR1|nr:MULTISPECIES: hypothetical protein [Streptomyces]KOG70550.1 hypothetical protein ADK78_28595 [Kitasatospora aureofaciens]MYT47330.1 hypothetical protein [Streptomyces sp. SID5471]KEF04660.1 hypothetical protein DF17_22495 [Streptomyces rimosus]KEF19921.1 hypothetical protein DF18_13875 [Streptomyces rimosus]KOT31376.1 hypothetical protein ADK84_30110 [Streptomyces sp. NRRL WC-3701]